ncbi:MAG: Permease of the drug/metabolite transporter (DMT) superfamily, partial [uncultured Craurococcus sp.]
EPPARRLRLPHRHRRGLGDELAGDEAADAGLAALHLPGAGGQRLRGAALADRTAPAGRAAAPPRPVGAAGGGGAAERHLLALLRPAGDPLARCLGGGDHRLYDAGLGDDARLALPRRAAGLAPTCRAGARARGRDAVDGGSARPRLRAGGGEAAGRARHPDDGAALRLRHHLDQALPGGDGAGAARRLAARHRRAAGGRGGARLRTGASGRGAPARLGLPRLRLHHRPVPGLSRLVPGAEAAAGGDGGDRLAAGADHRRARQRWPARRVARCAADRRAGADAGRRRPCIEGM